MEQRPESHRVAALIVLCLGQLMCILDISIVNIAIPSIQRDLGLATNTLQWLVTAYSLTYGGLLLVGGRVGDIYGRRRLLALGLTLFTVASAIGGMSTTAAGLLAARAGQGVGAAVITPTIVAFIAGLYPPGPRRNWALSILGAFNGAGFALGLLLGGLLTSTVGWRWVFFINLPIGLVVLGGVLWLLSETERTAESVNIPGAVLVTTAMGAATYTITQFDATAGLNPATLGWAGLTVLLFALLVWHERGAAQRLIPPGLLQHPSLQQALVGSTSFGLVIGASSLLLTLYLQHIAQLTPLRTGMAFLPQEAAVLLAAALAGRIVTKRGPAVVLAAGIACFGAGALILTTMSTAGEYVVAVLPGLLFLGLGIGCINVAGAIAATDGVAAKHHGIATGIWNTGNQMGTALGLATLTGIAGARTRTLLGALPAVGEAAAVVGGYRLAFLVAVGFAVAGLIFLYYIGYKKNRQRLAAAMQAGEVHRERLP